MIFGMFPMFEIGGQVRDNECGKIQKQVGGTSAKSQHGKKYFNVPAEKKQGKHIEEEMDEVGMKEARCDETIIFLSIMYAIRPHDSMLHDLAAVETCQRNDHIGCYESVCCRE